MRHGASRHIAELERASESATVGEAAERLSETGIGLALVFVCLPFLQPLPVGGLSTVLGPFVLLQGWQLVRGRHKLWLPRWIARRPLSERGSRILLSAGRKVLRLVDPLSRPRLRAVAQAERASGAGIALCGAMLTMPIPIPLSNIACALPVVLWSLALLEDDGLFALLAWLALGASVLFHAAIASFGVDGLRWLLS